ncbi:MAG TPA: hypothetical protein VK435_03695 [Thermodesulfovibrionales bacterium]|nr:hypothetical protein [Thermodesulfovibrionales bacterium]
MRDLQPSLKEWKALYDAAVAFKRERPWEWVSETEVFGVANPKTGEVGYCCIMGELGEMLAMAVYEGTEGLQGYLKIRKGQIKPGNPDALYVQKCLMLSFEGKKMLQEDELEIIDELGLVFRGRDAWPVFRSYKPGYFPWFLNRDEVLFMTVALNQAMVVFNRMKHDAELLHGSRKNLYLIRTLKKESGKAEWQDEWKTPAPMEENEKFFEEPVNEIRIQKLKKTLKPSTAVWEIDFFHTPTPIMQGERPVFPYAIMVMDHDTRFIFDMHLAVSSTYQKEFLGRFLDCLEQTAMIPLEILVRKNEAAKLLEPYTNRLSMKLSMVKKLRGIDHARREMEKHLK